MEKPQFATLYCSERIDRVPFSYCCCCFSNWSVGHWSQTEPKSKTGTPTTLHQERLI